MSNGVYQCELCGAIGCDDGESCKCHERVNDKQSFEDELSAKLEEWWVTEPFGFDHPDTKNGILKLMRWALTDSSIIREIDAALESIQASTSHPTTIMFISDALSKLKQARGEK